METKGTENKNIENKNTENKNTAAVKKTGKKRSTASIAAEFFIKVGITALTYKLASLSAGDEIVYKKDGKVYFGRIAAVEGDRVDILDGKLMVNGYGVYENTVYPTTAEGSKISYPYEVPKDTVFVLNDYRDDINDSRSFGAIPIAETKGKIVMILRRRGI